MKRWVLSGSISYVRGHLVDRNEPLDQIPPFGGMLKLSYAARSFTLSGRMNFAGRQRRLGEFENLFPVLDSEGNPTKDENGDYIFEQKSTEGFATFDIIAEYYFSLGALLHTLSLSIENITDTEYRKHLNRVKQIMPEPGRNVKLLYKVYF